MLKAICSSILVLLVVLGNIPENVTANDNEAFYKWPSPHFNKLEGLYYEPRSRQVGGFFFLVDGCPRQDQSSRAAAWIRLAYHDMATHNADDGTGGLDFSIAFELDRPENVGDGQRNSVRDFLQSSSRWISMSDLIAIGVAQAVVACGGPLIPYRSGRIDSFTAGPSGVPEPHQDLLTHIEAFRRQGFTSQEMIGLVACGHTLGGVRNPDFPGLVPNRGGFRGFDANDDTTVMVFDNNVVTEYLDGTSLNPLVVDQNNTMLSDLRIFSSDSNATMLALSDPAVFETTCASLLARMIDTVPRNIVLSPVYRPLQFKAGVPYFTVEGDTLVLMIDLRIHSLPTNPNRIITLKLASSAPAVIFTSPSTSSEVLDSPVFDKLGIIGATRYQFKASIPYPERLTEFWFEIDEGDGSALRVVQHNGKNYRIEQDVMLWDIIRTEVFVEEPRIVAAVRNTTSLSSLYFQTYTLDTTTFTPDVRFHNLTLDTSIPSTGGFNFYSWKAPWEPWHFIDLYGTEGESVYEHIGIDTSDKFLFLVPI